MHEDLARENSPLKYSFQQIFQGLFNASVKQNLPVAIWKLPELSQWEIIIGKEVTNLSNPEIEELEPGFLVNKFQFKGLTNALFIESILHFSTVSIDTRQVHNKLGADFERAFEEEINEISDRQEPFKITFDEDQGEVALFKKRVDEAIIEINSGAFQKVILSRKKEIAFSQGVDLINIFENLSNLYQNAFTSLIFIPGAGIWMGASPETLICIKENIFKTCSLAGTQQLKENVRMKDVLWSQKEIEEQAFVSRYIINCFKKIRLREYIEEGPKTVPAGNLLHLKTDFKVNMKEVELPKLGSQMLDLLHPTSAVCGMPHEAAFNFILSKEDFDRELYAGYLGPVNINNSIDLFVNLRCMKIKDQKAALFAGVGITEDSDAEKEWLETEMKFRTLLNVLSL